MEKSGIQSFLLLSLIGVGGYFAVTRLSVKEKYKKRKAIIGKDCITINVNNYDEFIDQFDEYYLIAKQNANDPTLIGYLTSSYLLGPDCSDNSPGTSKKPLNNEQALINASIHKRVYDNLLNENLINQNTYDLLVDELLDYSKCSLNQLNTFFENLLSQNK